MIRSLLMLRIKTTTVDMNADTDKKTVVVKTTLAYQTPLCEVFFFFSFAYTTSPAAMMKLVVFFRSSKTPYNFWWSGVADGHCAIPSGWCMLHLWRTCSIVWSSSPPHLHVLPSSCICVARRGDLFVWRASNTDNASVRKTCMSL